MFGPFTVECFQKEWADKPGSVVDDHFSGCHVAVKVSAAYPRVIADRADPALIFGLAPGGVCLASPVTRTAVRSYRTISPLPIPELPRRKGGIFSVALSLSSRTVGITHHRALWSPDFPLTNESLHPPAIVWPTPKLSIRFSRGIVGMVFGLGGKLGRK